MLAQENPTFNEAAQALYRANADSETRRLAEAREEALRLERYCQRKMEKAEKRANAAEKALAEKDAALMEQTAMLAQKDEVIAELKRQLSSK